jgi:HJR/Mrr/RecB family endonuclease
MNTFLQTGLSIVVSVFLFVIGYRQTVGAKKERIKTANEKLIEIILRRLILEKYTPTKSDIRKIIEGKSKEFRVKPSDLFSAEQILSIVYTRVFESDLITQTQREETLERLIYLFEEEQKDVSEELEILPESRKTRLYYYIAALGLVSSVIGVFLSSFDKIANFDTNHPEIYDIIGMSLLGSMIFIVLTYVFIRVKDSSESSEDTAQINHDFKNQIEFEKGVLKMFQKLGVEVLLVGEKNDGYDLIAKINGKHVAIELKYWKERPPIAYVNRAIQRLSQSMKKGNIPEGYIVAPKTFNLQNRLKNYDNIHLIEIKDLKQMIK